jgi:hypothetical protein
LIVAVLWILAVLFLLDWQLSMTRGQRIVAMVVGLGVVVWAYRHYSRPLLGQRESDLDMALMVERQQQIDSDLVAALQFESPEARLWGSTQLEGAVIDYVAEFSRGWNLLEGFSAKQFVKRGSILAVTLALLLAAVLWQPRYAAIFFARLGLGHQHYPTRTMIDEVQVNGTAIPVGEKPVRAGYGQPIDFAVQISGVVPADMRKIDLRSVSSGTGRPIELTMDPKSTSSGGPVVFRGQLPQLVDSLDFQVYLGDAWTDPSRLEVIPLPVIEPKLTTTPPAYARSAASVADEGTLGSRQLSVLEGSRVDLEIQCVNKPLIAATVTIDKHQYPLEGRDLPQGVDPGRHWTLPVEKTPLARIDSALKYEIQVTDEDGLHLPHPIDGYIRIKIDRPPTIIAAVDVQYFLPTTGMPEINYTVNDDYGISRVQLYAEVIHPPPGAAGAVGSVVGGAPAAVEIVPAVTPVHASEPAQNPAPSASEITVAPIPVLDLKPNQPILRPKLPYNGVYHLALNQFKLVKGDQLRVTLEAIDYRGDQPGKPTRSDPLLLNITDESGIMTALSETDLRAAHQMDLLIQRQTQTGGSR